MRSVALAEKALAVARLTRASLIMPGVGAGNDAAALYLFTKDACGHGQNHKLRHGRV